MEHARQLQADYGKWLISSLLFLHSAAIGGLAFKLESLKQVVDSLWWFVIGILLALLSGLMSWWNFTLNDNAMQRLADHRMLTDPKYWPTTSPYQRLIWFTLVMALVSGISSAACLVAGSAFVARAIKHLSI
jgi:hypothetical protein